MIRNTSIARTSWSLPGIFFLLLLFTSYAQAATWICGSGHWNWNGVPMSCWDWWDYPDEGEDVWIVDLLLPRTVTYVNPGYNPALNDIYVNSLSGSAAAIYQEQDILTASIEFIGTDGKGYFRLTGGANVVTTALVLGDLSGGEGSYKLGGIGGLSASNTYVGERGVGTFNQSGGDHEVTYKLSLGRQASGTGEYNLSDVGKLSTSNTYVGKRGKGTFNQSGGDHVVTNNLYLGDLPGSRGDYNLSGTGELSTSNAYVGYAGWGEFNQTNSTYDHDVAKNLFIGHKIDAYGAYDLSAGDLHTENTYVGYAGKGNLYLLGGHHSVSNTLYIAYETNSNGRLYMSLNSLSNLTVYNDVYVGYSGDGIVQQYGGVVEVADTVYVSFSPGSDGYVGQVGGTTTAAMLHVGSATGGIGEYALSKGSLSIVDEIIHGSGYFRQLGGTHSVSGGLVMHGGGEYLLGDAVLNAHDEIIFQSNSDTATFTQKAGENNVSGNLYLGQFSTTEVGKGEYVLESGSLSVEGYTYIGNSSPGLFTQTGGLNRATWLYLGNNSSGGGTYYLNGGNLQVMDEVIAYQGSGFFTQTNGTHTVTMNVKVGAYGGTGSYDMQGGALEVWKTLTVGSNGNMEISGGTVKADAVDLTTAGAFNFLGGRLQANGVSGSLVNTGGTLVPGYSPGLLTVDGDYTQAINGTLEIELGGLSMGAEHDAVNVSGALNLDGTLQVLWWDSFTPAFGDSFDILDWGSISGSFKSLSLPDLPPGLEWDTSNLYVDGTLVVGEEPIFADSFE